MTASSPTDIEPVLDATPETDSGARGRDATIALYRRRCSMIERRTGRPCHPEGIGRTSVRRGDGGQRASSTPQDDPYSDILQAECIEFPEAYASDTVFGRTACAPLLREGTVIGAIISTAREVRRLHRPDALLETFADQAVIAIENVRLFKNSESAMPSCARPWSIRRQRPRCSASSAARRPTCSRCSMPSSRARRGFVGSMTWCCDCARGTSWFRGLILVPFPSGRVEVSIDEPHLRWVSEHGTLHVPDVRAQTDFPMLGSGSGSRTHLVRSPSPEGEFIGALTARRTEVRPFTPAQIKLLETFADQAVIAIENVRLFNETEGSAGTADGDERDFGCHRQLTDGYSAGAGCRRRKRRPAVEATTRRLFVRRRSLRL